MSDMEFFQEELAHLPDHCRMCDRLVGYIQTELIPLLGRGVIDRNHAAEAIFHATIHCGRFLETEVTIDEISETPLECNFYHVPIQQPPETDNSQN